MALLNTDYENLLKIKSEPLNLFSFKVVVVLLAITNIIFSLFFDLQEMRIVRLTTTIILFFWFLSLKLKKKSFFIIIFSLIVLSDIGMFNYENKWFCFMRFVTFILVNILLCNHVYRRLYIAKLKPIAIVAILVLFISNIFLAIYLEDLFDFSVFGEIHKYLYYIYAFTTFCLILFTVLYSLNDYSKKIDVFLGSVVAFLISDLLLMIGYYEDVYLAIQVERSFQILAIALLIYYVALYNRDNLNKQQDVLIS